MTNKTNITKEDHLDALNSLLEKTTDEGELLALNYAIACIDNPLMKVQEVFVGPNSDDLALAKLKITRLINLLGDIVECGTNRPAQLVAFNSPCLQLAVMEIYEHNNPDAPVDDRSRAIFQQMATVGYNV